jgi:hypothetical protein
MPAEFNSLLKHSYNSEQENSSSNSLSFQRGNSLKLLKSTFNLLIIFLIDALSS